MDCGCVSTGFFLFSAALFCSAGQFAACTSAWGNLASLACWAAAASLLNVMSGSLYAVAHRDNIGLSLLSPLFDFYQGIFLNCAWIIATFDQARGGKMRW